MPRGVPKNPKRTPRRPARGAVHTKAVAARVKPWTDAGVDAIAAYFEVERSAVVRTFIEAGVRLWAPVVGLTDVPEPKPAFGAGATPPAHAHPDNTPPPDLVDAITYGAGAITYDQRYDGLDARQEQTGGITDLAPARGRPTAEQRARVPLPSGARSLAASPIPAPQADVSVGIHQEADADADADADHESA